MTHGETFENSFWDPEITCTSGWDKLVRRMKDGRKVCQDITYFFKERAKIESDYSKALANLAKKADGNEETGLLGHGWKQMKLETEGIYKVHEDTAKTFSQLAEQLTNFNDEQKKAKHQHEDSVKKANKTKLECYNKTMGLKKTYEVKCRDYDIAQENLRTLQNTVSFTKKDSDKSEKNVDKSKDSMVKEDIVYKYSVEALEKARLGWESTMETACKEFHKLEEERISFLRNQIWEATNAESLACVLHDTACESVRLVLETCDVTEDIWTFISNFKSGSVRPSRIEYESYYDKLSMDKQTLPPALAKTPGAKSVFPGRAPAMIPTRMNQTFDIHSESGYASVEDLKPATLSRPQPPPKVQSLYAEVDVTNVNDRQQLAIPTKPKPPQFPPPVISTKSSTLAEQTKSKEPLKPPQNQARNQHIIA